MGKEALQPEPFLGDLVKIEREVLQPEEFVTRVISAYSRERGEEEIADFRDYYGGGILFAIDWFFERRNFEGLARRIGWSEENHPALNLVERAVLRNELMWRYLSTRAEEERNFLRIYPVLGPLLYMIKRYRQASGDMYDFYVNLLRNFNDDIFSSYVSENGLSQASLAGWKNTIKRHAANLHFRALDSEGRYTRRVESAQCLGCEEIISKRPQI